MTIQHFFIEENDFEIIIWEIQPFCLSLNVLTAEIVMIHWFFPAPTHLYWYDSTTVASLGHRVSAANEP